MSTSRRGSPARSRPSLAPPSGRPASPPPAPVFATTGQAQVDSILATLDQTIAPFRQAPPEEQGAAGWVSHVLGAGLGVVNAPAMFIDAAASQGVQAVLDAFGLNGLFPPMPVAVIGLSMHMGTPHTHTHPPSTTPPAPPIPLPSMGIAFLAGSASVLVNGVPALRAGDIGIGFTCGSMAPPFEIMTGASGVYFGGARVARYGMDITFHCNPAPAMGAFAVGMGVAGALAGAAGAAAQASAGNSGAAIAQAAQAALDAAALAVSMLRGKDPAGPPGVGMLLGPPGTVLAGGPPIPNLGALAQGKIYQRLGRALRSAARRIRQRNPPPDANGTRCQGGEPVHVITGEAYDTYTDFVSFLGGFRWSRYVSSANARQRGVLGWGWRHRFEARLQVRLHRATFIGFEGETIDFSRLRRGQTVQRAHGYVLRRHGPCSYTVSHRRLGTLEFELDSPTSLEGRPCRLRRGRVLTQFTYDAHRRLVQVREHDVRLGTSATYRVHYDRDGGLVGVDGARTGEPTRTLVRYAYDGAGNLHAVTDSAGAVQRHRYDGAHRRIAAVDQRGYAFTWEYDHEGRCSATEGQDGLWSARFEYAPLDRVTRMTLHDGSVRSYHYDEHGVLTKIVDPYGGVLQRVLDQDGRLLAEIDAGGRELRHVYDANGAHVARIDRFGHVFPPQLDAPGLPDPFVRSLPQSARDRLFGDTRPKPPLRAAARDDHGRITRAVDGRRWEYDAVGNVVRHVDRDGREHRQIITSWNLIGARVDPLGNKTLTRYQPHEHVTAVVDPGGTTTEYDYDAKDRLAVVRRHGRVRESYVYDAGDRLIAKHGADGAPLLTMTPHPCGLVGTIALASGGRVELDYDPRGKVTVANTTEHAVTRSWDERRRIRSERCDAVELEHRYDDDHHVATTVAGRFEIRYERAADGELRITDPTGHVQRIRPRFDGCLELDHGNGTRELQRYDDEGRLLARVAKSKGGRSWDVRHDYTPHGDLVATRDSARGLRRFTIDAAHRLVAETLPGGEQLRYVLDGAGNLVEMPGLDRVRLDTGNRLATANDEDFVYDARDHVAERRRGHATVRYVRDSLDQLIEVDDGEAESWRATYDGLGRRISAGRGEHRTTFVWDGDRLAAEVDPAGRLRIYVYAGRRSLVPLGFVDYAGLDADPEDGRRYALFCDQVGLPQHIEDADGRVVWWADATSPYGAVYVRPGAEIEFNLRWPGHYHDPDTGLHYNRFRYYDPRLGRYLESDPLGCGGGVNVYAYASNPLVAVDVLGLADHNPDARPNQEGGDGGEGRPLAEDPELAALHAQMRRVIETGVIPLTGDEALSDGTPMPPGSYMVDYGDQQTWFDPQGRIRRVEGVIDPPADYTKHGVSDQTAPPGYEPGRDHRGHLRPERGVPDDQTANVPENVIAEHGTQSNLSTKKRWENRVIREAQENPDNSYRSIHEPQYDSDTDVRPSSVVHMLEENGYVNEDFTEDIPNPT